MQLCAKYSLIFTSFYISPALLEALDYTNSFKFTLEGISLKKVHEGGGGGGGVQSDPSSPLLTDYSSDLYLRSIETTWCLIGFHGNHNIINDVTSRPPSWIINFSDFFHSNWTLKIVRKQHLTIGIYRVVRSMAQSLVFRHFFSKNSCFFDENLNFRSQHTSYTSYYDDVINRDVI